jgi:DNA-binding MurR/RpiR family transcriptional regulator
LLYKAYSATLEDLREAVTTLEDAERIARRVFGGSHPLTVDIEASLQTARAALRARETPSPPPESA